MYKVHLFGYCVMDFDYYLYVKEFSEVTRILELAQARYNCFEFTVDWCSDITLPFSDNMIMKGWYNK